jgi:hypothetical protein
MSMTVSIRGVVYRLFYNTIADLRHQICELFAEEQ